MSRRAEDRAPVLVSGVLLVVGLLRGLGVPVVEEALPGVDAVRHPRERHEPLPLLAPVPQPGQPRVHPARLDRHQPVAEVGDVAPAVGVEEVVQRGDQAHRVPELGEVAVPAELGEPEQAAGLPAPGREPERDRQVIGGVGGHHRPVLVRSTGNFTAGPPGDVDRLIDLRHRDLLAVEPVRRRVRRVVDVVLDVDPLVNQFLAGGGLDPSGGDHQLVSAGAGTIATMPRWMRRLSGFDQRRIVDIGVRPVLTLSFGIINRIPRLKLAVAGLVGPRPWCRSPPPTSSASRRGRRKSSLPPKHGGATATPNPRRRISNCGPSNTIACSAKVNHQRRRTDRIPGLFGPGRLGQRTQLSEDNA